MPKVRAPPLPAVYPFKHLSWLTVLPLPRCKARKIKVRATPFLLPTSFLLPFIWRGGGLLVPPLALVELPQGIPSSQQLPRCQRYTAADFILPVR